MHLLFLPAAGARKGEGVSYVNEHFFCYSGTPTDGRAYASDLYSGGVVVSRAWWDRCNCFSIRLASVVSEGLTLSGEGMSREFVILRFAKDQLQHGCLVSSSVPSCCGSL